jgi:hypothetical protein
VDVNFERDWMEPRRRARHPPQGDVADHREYFARLPSIYSFASNAPKSDFKAATSTAMLSFRSK